ncbi:MAG: alanine dehydrogenase [Flavobacteriales bacterium]|nr:alanine dehydrogenase [Flavobacteriales bacterium]
MKLGIIREEKTPEDWRVVFSPKQCIKIIEKYPEIEITIQSSSIRCFNDSEYKKVGLTVKEDISDCDILIGVKEVPIDSLIPNKEYFFFSHTYKEQEYNRPLLKAIINKNVAFHDHELLKNASDLRVVFFGKWAGIVGAYNGIKTLGSKFRLFDLPKAISLDRKSDVEKILSEIDLPNIKIVLTGKGHVSAGSREILEDANIREVSKEEYLNEEFDFPVFVNLGCEDYAQAKDGRAFVQNDYFRNPQDYKSSFLPYTRLTDMIISGHYWDQNAPQLWEVEDMKSEDFKISVIADITCDIEGSIPSTIRPSTIEDPNYGYHPDLGEVECMDDNAIAVMAVDNLPCELAKDASENFGDMFIKNVLPAFFNNDEEGILHGSLMTKDGHLTEKYNYLQDFIDVKE